MKNSFRVSLSLPPRLPLLLSGSVLRGSRSSVPAPRRGGKAGCPHDQGLADWPSEHAENLCSSHSAGLGPGSVSAPGQQSLLAGWSGSSVHS